MSRLSKCLCLLIKAAEIVFYGPNHNHLIFLVNKTNDKSIEITISSEMNILHLNLHITMLSKLAGHYRGMYILFSFLCVSISRHVTHTNQSENMYLPT